MPAVMEKPSFENFSPKGKKVSKEYGGGDSGGDSSGESRGKKPGSRRSFLQTAKRFGKQGRHGKGTEVDAETYAYFVRILELLRKDEFDTDDERETFVENSLSHGEGNEVTLASNQLVSRVIENLLPLASEERIYTVCQAFTPGLRVIVSDTYASHVLEKLLELTSSDKWRGSGNLTDWFEKTSMFVLNNFEDFTFDKYGSYVTKKVLECLSGQLDRPPLDQDIAGPKGSKSSILRLELYGTRTRNTKWEKILQDFAKRFAAWPQFNDLNQKPETSRLLQNVIQTVSRTDKSEAVVKELMLRVLSTFPEGLESDDAAHRILEVALSVAPKKEFGLIFNKYYKGNLGKFTSGSCYITLQKIISAAPTEQYFVSIFDELAPELNTIVQDGRTVIVYSLASQCAKYNTKQKELWKLIKEALKTVKKSDDGKTNLLMKLITIKPKTEKVEPDHKTFSSTFYGSSTVQMLMDFETPVVSEVLKCFDELKAPELLKLALDPKASFIISKMFKSWGVPQENKEKLLLKLQDSLVELATTKFGSRIIDLIWLWADIPQKTTVANVLSQRIPVLSANKYGRFLVETMGLQALVRNKKEWMEHMAAQDKRKRDVDKIATELGIAGSSTPKSAKKEKKRKSEAAQEATETERVETPKSKKKNRKSEITLTELADTSAAEVIEADTPKKSKKKQRKSHMETEEPNMKVEDDMEGHVETPKEKKKRKKSESIPSEETSDYLSEVSETPKKKKKNRKSERNEEEAINTTAEVESNDTPKKKKKKDRVSKQF